MMMMTMVMNPLFLFAVAVLPFSLVDGKSTALVVQTGSASCSGAFSVDSISVDCEECNFGKDVGVSGTISSSGGLPSDATATVKACILMGSICRTLTESNVNVCNNVKGTSGEECPSAGTYSFDTHFKLPGDDGNAWFGSGYTITAKATLTDSSSGSTTNCSVKVKAVTSSEGYQMVAFSMVAVSVLAVAACVGYRSRKRRAAVTLDDIGRSFEIRRDIELPSGNAKTKLSSEKGATAQKEHTRQYGVIA